MTDCNILDLEINGNDKMSLQMDRGSAGGTDDYNKLFNKPQIEGVTLEGNKTFPQLGLDAITPQEIDEIMFGGN